MSNRSPSKFQEVLGSALISHLRKRSPGRFSWYCIRASASLRSASRWYPRSFTSKPGLVKLNSAPPRQCSPACFRSSRFPVYPVREVALGSNSMWCASGRW